MSNEDILANYYNMMESIDYDSATIASWTKSAVGHALQSGKSAIVSPLKLMHDNALDKTEFVDVSNEISSLYDCVFEFKKAEMNIEDIANISQKRIKDDSLNKMKSNLDNFNLSLKTAVIRAFGMISNSVKYLNNDIIPKLKDIIKNFSSKLKNQFFDMLHDMVKIFFKY